MCPKCKNKKSRVIETRYLNHEIERTRRCLKCDTIYVSYEIVSHSFTRKKATNIKRVRYEEINSKTN